MVEKLAADQLTLTRRVCSVSITMAETSVPPPPPSTVSRPVSEALLNEKVGSFPNLHLQFEWGLPFWMTY